MKSPRLCLSAILIITFTLSSAPAPAQGKGGGMLGMWSIKTMTEQACVNIAKRYNLDPAQDKYTRALMAKNVKAWLNKHGTTFEKLAGEILKNGMASKNAPPADMVKAWARQAKPMFEDAKSFILAGNEEWAEILNEDQKRIHEFDLKQMDPQFEQMDKQFARWEEGKWEKGDFFLPRSPAANPRRGGGVQVNPPREHFWKIYVDRYIDRYSLNEAQKESAYGILKDCRARATKYRESRGKEIDDATEKMRQKARDKDTAGLRQSREELGKYNKPISDLFAELKERLERLPTAAQKAQYEEKLAAQRKTVQEARERKTAAKKSNDGPQKTLPAKTQKPSESKPDSKAEDSSGD